MITACFRRHALWGILGFFGQRNSQSPHWWVSCPQFTWAYRTSQWTPLQTPRAFVSSSKPLSQILSARAAPFIGRGKYPLCAVHALLACLVIRGDGPGPLFLSQNGQPLSSALLTEWLWRIMASVGISGQFSSHSFHMGAATVAKRNSIPDHLIQELGRWNSNAFQGYIRTPSTGLSPLSQKLAWWCQLCVPHRVAICSSHFCAYR